MSTDRILTSRTRHISTNKSPTFRYPKLPSAIPIIQYKSSCEEDTSEPTSGSILSAPATNRLLHHRPTLSIQESRSLSLDHSGKTIQNVAAARPLRLRHVEYDFQDRSHSTNRLYCCSHISKSSSFPGFC